MRLLTATRNLKKLLTKISSWCLSKTKRKKSGPQKNKRKKKKNHVKKRPAFILIKNLQIKHKKKKRKAPKLPTLGPVFWASNFSLCTLKKQWKNYQHTACLEDISSSKKNTKLFLGPPAKAQLAVKKSFSSHFAFLYKKLTKNVLNFRGYKHISSTPVSPKSQPIQA